MSDGISSALKRRVFERASGLCEYCLIHDRDAWFGHQIDHIISRKHGGGTTFANLALACMDCHLAKSSDPVSLTSRDGNPIPFFNPRQDRWAEHFNLNEHRIESIGEPGAATCRILGFNLSKRLMERRALLLKEHYPSLEALALLRI